MIEWLSRFNGSLNNEFSVNVADCMGDKTKGDALLLTTTSTPPPLCLPDDVTVQHLYRSNTGNNDSVITVIISIKQQQW